MNAFEELKRLEQMNNNLEEMLEEANKHKEIIQNEIEKMVSDKVGDFHKVIMLLTPYLRQLKHTVFLRSLPSYYDYEFSLVVSDSGTFIRYVSPSYRGRLFCIRVASNHFIEPRAEENEYNDWEIYLSKHYNEIIKTFEEQTIQQYQNALNEKIKVEKLNNQNLTDLYNKIKENV